LSNKEHLPTYNNNLKDSIPTPLNKEDCPDLIFKNEDENKGYLSTEVKVKSFKNINSK
jgi:adenine specific DNA methylase Mod